jgi:hypothetical protein
MKFCWQSKEHAPFDKVSCPIRWGMLVVKQRAQWYRYHLLWIQIVLARSKKEESNHIAFLIFNIRNEQKHPPHFRAKEKEAFQQIITQKLIF